MEEQIEKQESEKQQEPNMNAATHGLRTDNLIPGEDQAEFDAHKAAVYAGLQPGTPEEEYWAKKMMLAMWKEKRAERYEFEILDTFTGSLESDVLLDPRYTLLQRYQVTIERSVDRASRQITRLQKLRGFNRYARPVETPAPQPEAKTEPKPEPKQQTPPTKKHESGLDEDTYKMLEALFERAFFSGVPPAGSDTNPFGNSQQTNDKPEAA